MKRLIFSAFVMIFSLSVSRAVNGVLMAVRQ